MGKRIGFVGLGTMGRPMAANLLKAGHRLTVFDVVPTAQEPLVAMGAAAAASASEAADAAEVVISMLPAPPDVLGAMLGSAGVVEGLRPGGTVIDMSTIDPSTTRRVAREVEAKGGRMLDAPVSGSSTGARDGTLTIMVGGDREVLEEHRDVLEVMGSNVIHCGPIGMGETVKLANNLLAAAGMVAVAEAFLLGMRCGADPRVLYEVISKSTGSCWALRRAPVRGLFPDAPINEGFAPGFMVDLMHKDLGLILSAAEEQRLPMPLTGLVRQLYALAGVQGYGRQDASAVAKILGTLD
jgi:3-hydroxyisobutyrate dehydrogenase